jgi:hypothetical protein
MPEYTKGYRKRKTIKPYSPIPTLTAIALTILGFLVVVFA